MIDIIIADDHPRVREAWRFILDMQNGMAVVALCGSGQEVLDRCHKSLPDLVLMDINMSPLSGFETTRLLLKNFPTLKIIGISIHAEPSYAQQMLRIGGKGFITKSSSAEEMVAGISEAMAGNTYICREVRSRMHPE
ncbi:MAG: response regulator transcription factor [Chitinophagaceae bacterium]|nr:response regulator transcription factor [Chitinophagaceae bacterium]